MRILCIRGENIASLAKPFEISLDAAPLSSAGLFAITGETGAGKSSILDAMCLALYGSCPRLSGDGTRETVTDIDGHDLRSNDPRMVLRRGAAMGLAEVTFQADDGETYTAAWQARRSRDKIDGRLQSVERSLLRLSDQQMLETQLTRVNDRVVALTGLTYDEFRRTVLLAQGDFDAFLSAKTDERAAILEKVTGTGIYREISRAVFERHRQAKSDLATLQTRRAEHHLLSAEERAELDAALDRLQKEQDAAAAALAQVQKGLDRYKAVADARADLETAAHRARQAQEAVAALAQQRQWLAAWDDAKGLRAEVRERSEAGHALAQARRDVETRFAAHQSKEAEVASAETLFHEADVAHQQADDVFKAFGPVWTEAADLDSQIVTAVKEQAEAAKGVAQREAETAGCAQEHADLTAKQENMRATLDADQRRMEQTAGYDVLLAHWTMLEDRLSARIAAVDLAASSQMETSQLARSIAGDGAQRAHLQEEIRQAAGRIDAARAVQAGIRQERENLIKGDPASRLDGLRAASMNLRRLQQGAAEVRRADAELAASQGRLVTAQNALETHRETVTSQRAKRDVARGVIARLRQPSAAATAAASREAAAMRLHLVAGEPCPVCQSTSHPVMADSDIAKLAEALRKELADAQQEHDAAEALVNKAMSEADAAQAMIAGETSARPKLDKDIERAIAQFADALEPLQNAPFAADVPHDPRSDDGAFEAVFAQMDTRQAKAEADLARLAELNEHHDGAARAIDAARDQSASCEAQIREIDGRVSDTEKKIAALKQTVETAQKTVVDIDQRLRPILAPTGLDVEQFGREGAGALQALRENIAGLSEVQASIAKRREDVAGISAKLATAAAALNAAQANLETAKKVEEGRIGTVERLKAARADLLEGEETNTHRTRTNERRLAAQKAATAAQSALGDVRTAAALAKNAWEAARETALKAEARAAAAQEALVEACTAAGLDPERVVELHGSDAQLVQDRRKAVQDSDTEAAKAEGAHKERDGAVQRLLAQGMPETPEGELAAQKEEIEAQIKAHGEARGRLAERRDADRAAAKALSGLEHEIDEARKVFETWLAVSDAIGSAKGDRFAQIAQAVTLAMLVERANHHLDDLKPRYQLRVASSDLALHVIDRDMAGDARPTRLMSGGERFLISLALALALSGMGNRGALVGTLFIDEGFGSLDADSLDLAIDALERLQAQGRTIGVISHVQAMKDRIPVQVQVSKTGGGASEVTLVTR
ncbi:AAA family ATPase [Sulfitobacter geojensis]|uniref:AAA family ATPase n=1 Tax=Sulfitobacter geojensis TaxID=1342299 RepID=UPI00046A0732|nr:AAA family ATPase [Sulfitobacter geojensis]KHA53772.1 SMC domain protein [Sulfitobacter geojensis]NYI27590.1 exonuclease SbcC [Sulfitobacter geojensis]